MDNCSDLTHSLSGNLTREEIWQRFMEAEERETISKIPAFLYMSILIGLGIPGNLIVLLVYRYRFPSSTTKCFIMAMAAFDLCSCLIAMPFEIVDLRFDYQLDLPVGCKIMRFLVSLFAYGSVLVLIGVAVDRFKLVCRPYGRQMSVRKSKQGIILITVLAAFFSVPNLIIYGRQTKEVKGVILVECSIDDAFSDSILPKLYFIIQGFCWFLAIVALCIMYGFIIYNIKKANKRRSRLESKSYSDNNLNSIVKIKGTFSKNHGRTISIEKGANTSGEITKSKSKSRNVIAPQNTDKSNIIETANSGDVSDVHTGQSTTDGRATKKTRSVITRLFSRDVNPLTDLQDGADTTEAEIIKESVTLTTISDQEEGTLNISLKYAGTGMEDGASLQNLLTDDTFDESRSCGGMDNPGMEQEPLKPHGVFHISASVGNNLSDDSPALNKRHKILGESLQELNVLNMETNLPSFQNPDPHSRHYSDENLSPHSESHREIVEDDTHGGSSKFPRSKSVTLSMMAQYKKDDKSERNIFYIKASESFHGDKDTSHCDSQEMPPVGEMAPKSRVCVHSKAEETEFVIDSTRPTSSEPNSKNSRSHASISESNTESYRSASEGRRSSQQTAENKQQTRSENIMIRPRRVSSSQRHTSECSNNEYNVTSSQAVLYNRKQSQSRTRELKISKIAMMMFHVTLGFVISYLPHLSVQLVKALKPGALESDLCDATFFGFYHVILRSIFLNHTINPLIYGYYNKRFREYCARLLVSPCQFLKKSYNNSLDRTHSFSMEQT